MVQVPKGISSDDAQFAEVVLNEKARQLQEGVVPRHEIAIKIEEAQAQMDIHAQSHSHGHGHGHGHGPSDGAKQSVWLLAYCCIGIMVSFTLNGVVLEKMTTHRVLPELSLTFVFCLFYSLAALILRHMNKEKPSTVPQSKLMIIGLLAFGSTISSMVALRYVSFITRILGKSCKSIPVMVMGLFLGKSYAFKKYVSVLVLSAGVAVFLVGTAHEKQHRAVQSNDNIHHEHHAEEAGHTPNMFLGFSLLMVSLMLDGATGALEDRFLEKYHIGAFDLMYIVNIWKCAFAGIGMIVMGELPTFVEKALPNMPNLILLSATGAFGQAFIFFTISKFGALTTSIIGTCRKVLSIVLSVILFGHVLTLEQTIGLFVAFAGIGLNWVRIEPCWKTSASLPVDEIKDLEAEDLLETSDDTMDSESESDNDSAGHDRSELEDMKPRDEIIRSKEEERGLELVNMWHRHHEEATKEMEHKPVHKDEVTL